MRCWSALGASLMMGIAVPAAATTVASDDAGSIYRVAVDRTGSVVEDCADLAARHTALCGDGLADADILFVNADRTLSMPAQSFSLLAAGGAPIRVSAYDAAGRLLGVAEAANDRVELSGIGQIARIAVRPALAREADVNADRLSHLPEPATWAMLIAGFALIAAAIRRVIRHSEARFDARIRRIAAGDAA
ncbi:PEPxxWA-CTERM sorting domain-containing protein [Sphingomonas mollis]|uniref:PEPxxWA-CTERM sorting domain-containing protein n=1 Tax=Sphingomonas mollis TaxID=2795726 RepID=A0ABS0XPC6_9SPHN|nr:PEPxxWA-CTERM sorting domain-containing protein [Sphingomonas sp. BT553]MBJ6121888.1 PEPxxWA-CTERM sorting domain-containing protein [Sphingomonas sp. BT553]